jgi:hypothetical protein
MKSDNGRELHESYTERIDSAASVKLISNLVQSSEDPWV